MDKKLLSFICLSSIAPVLVCIAALVSLHFWGVGIALATGAMLGLVAGFLQARIAPFELKSGNTLALSNFLRIIVAIAVLTFAVGIFLSPDSSRSLAMRVVVALLTGLTVGASFTWTLLRLSLRALAGNAAGKIDK